MTDYELVRVAVAATMLACASFFDLRTRTIHDFVWIIFGAAAGLLFFLDMPSGNALQLYAFSIFITSLFAAILYKTKIIGHADILAMIILASILPLYSHGPLLAPSLGINPLAPLGVMMNAAFLSLFVMIQNVFRNASYSKAHGDLFQGFEHESRLRKAVAFMIGYRSQSTSQFAFPIETTVDGRKEFDFGIKDAENTAFETEKERKLAWVTTGIPFLLLMFTGFVMYVLVGDILSLIFSLH